MNKILLALLLTTTTTQVQADTDFTRVLKVEDYPCSYKITEVEKLNYLEAMSDCRKEDLKKKDRPYYKDKLDKDKDKDKNRPRVVPVSEPTPVLLILLGLFFFGFSTIKRFYTHRLN